MYTKAKKNVSDIVSQRIHVTYNIQMFQRHLQET